MRYKSMIWVLMTLICMGFLSACDDKEDEVPAKVPATSTGTFVDERDGLVYNTVRYGNLEWMAQ
ncbi:MAG: hypothetical protein IJK09_06535, partial [Prevotella sp.]|nr:hypothetical protein [Prevotella sp.]